MPREPTTTDGHVESLSELIEDLVNRGELRPDRCVDLSELSELVQELDMNDEDAQTLHELLEERGFELRDDCGRPHVEETSYVNDQLADRTTDAMSLFLQEVRRYPLLSREEEVELSKQIERGDLAAKERLVN